MNIIDKYNVSVVYKVSFDKKNSEIFPSSKVKYYRKSYIRALLRFSDIMNIIGICKLV